MMTAINIFVEPQYRPDLCCVRDPSRPTLTGVFLDPSGWLVAADGFVLVACPCRIEGAPEGWQGAIVPALLFSKAQAVKARNLWQTKPLLTIEGTLVCADIGDGMRAQMSLIEGRFPAWRTFIPSGEQNDDSDAHLAVDVRKAVTMHRALGLGHGAVLRLIASPNKGPVYAFGPSDDKAFGLIMPLMWNLGTMKQRVAAIVAELKQEAKNA